MEDDKEKKHLIEVNSIDPSWELEKGDVVIMQISGKYYIGIMLDEKYTSPHTGPFFTQVEAFDIARCLAKGKSIYVCNFDGKLKGEKDGARRTEEKDADRRGGKQV